jgi:membrane-bound lytic murein transglycosylase D
MNKNYLIIPLLLCGTLAGARVSFTGSAVIQVSDTIPGPDSIPLPDTLDPLVDPSLEQTAGDRLPFVDPDTFTMKGEIELRTGDNLDSLLNLWYVNQSLETAVDDYDPEADTLLPDFPDSIYMARLAEIPSVVDLTYNRIVKNYINVYTRKRREQMRFMLGLSEYYFPMFEEVFDLHGVPYELKYLSVIESALNPRAVSRAGAVGTWQFMYSTGRHYGLTINSLVDERRDPLAATHAAARYLVDLHRIYRDWTMALAAYNCGPGNVNRAIRRSGGRRNFWDIYYYLPRETRGYVPAFIAATYAMNFYSEHLLTRAPLQLPRHTDTIRIHEPLHLKQVSEVLGIAVRQLRDMNPQYRQDIIPATGKQPYAIRIPVEHTASFIDRHEAIFSHKDSIFFDKEKLVASPSRYSSAYRVDLPPDKYDKLYYTVRSGDNVGYVADWYDVRASDLRYWNNISRNLIRTGQKLVIYKPKGNSAKYRDINNMSFSEKQRSAGRSVSTSVASSPSNTSSSVSVPVGAGRSNYITYTVRQGDTLWEIARKYPGITETDIARLNNISNSSRITPGQVLLIKPKS